jgi:hypothetical protein
MCNYSGGQKRTQIRQPINSVPISALIFYVNERIPDRRGYWHRRCAPLVRINERGVEK